MKKQFLVRSLYAVALSIGVFFLPLWMTVVIALGGVFLFDSYYEVMVAGLLIDLLYSSPTPLLYNVTYIGTIGGLFLFGVNTYSKKFLRSV